jgi:5-deoxy-glucuronate isomerase
MSGTATPRHPWHLGAVTEVTPERAGWECCGLRLLPIPPGEAYDFVTGGAEMAVLPLSGEAVSVEVEGRSFELAGRSTVFAAVSDWAYLPIDAEVRLSSAGGVEVALPSARATRRFDPAYGAARDGQIGVRGPRPATPQVTN